MEQVHDSMQDNQAAKALAKEKHRKAFTRGCVWLGVGVLFMGLSFGINFAMFHSNQSFTTIMYIMTSIGAVCIVKSLVDILGF